MDQALHEPNPFPFVDVYILILIVYIIGGIVLMLSAALRGISTGSRILRSICGIGLALCGAWVLLTPVGYRLNYFVFLVPLFILAGWGYFEILRPRKAVNASLQRGPAPVAEASPPAYFAAQPAPPDQGSPPPGPGSPPQPRA